jgi:hypothetical protein
MSFTTIEPAKLRLNRSELAVPGSNPAFLEKAAGSEADVVFLDLEDSVAPDEKERARANVIEALNDLDWSGTTVSVRINGLDTPYMYRDVIDVVEQAGDKLDLLMVPKVGTAADVYAVDMLLSQIEQAKGIASAIGLELIIETALGMQNLGAIAAASARTESLHFGVADYAASTRARTTSIGGANPAYHVLTDADGAGARAPLGRRVALRHRARGGGGAGSGAAPPRRPIRRFQRRRWLRCPGGTRGGAGVRGQVGDPPASGRARQRGLYAHRRGGDAGAPRPRGHGRRGPGREGGGRARRPYDRYGIGPPGRGDGRQGGRNR